MMPNLQRISAKEPENGGTSSSSHFASLCEERTSPHSRIVSRVLAIRIKRKYETRRRKSEADKLDAPQRAYKEQILDRWEPQSPKDAGRNPSVYCSLRQVFVQGVAS